MVDHSGSPDHARLFDHLNQRQGPLVLLLTMGDPASTTVEIVDRLLSDPAWRRRGGILIGSAWHWRDQLRRLGRPADQLPVVSFPELRESDVAGSVSPTNANADPMSPLIGSGMTKNWVFCDAGPQTANKPAEQMTPLERGRVAMSALEVVRQLLLAIASASGKGSEENQQRLRRVAVVTGPIDKNACAEAGFPFPGQTEFFQELWGCPGVMILAGERLKVGLATNHLPLAAVPGALSQDGIVRKLSLFIHSLRLYYRISRPNVAVCALNPHAGDGGLFGTEDQELVGPAVVQAGKTLEADIHGPIPADSVFHFAAKGRYDGVLALYHDQGLGPLKTLHFDSAVNLTGGLPHLRVSPDHGPGRDLFLRGEASSHSWRAAWKLAFAAIENACEPVRER